MVGEGVTQFTEIGGKVLSPMITRTAPEAIAISVLTMADIEALAKEI